MSKLIRPSDETISDAADAVVTYTTCCDGGNLFTDGEGNLRVVEGNAWVEGWEGLGKISAATERLAVKRINEALDARL